MILLDVYNRSVEELLLNRFEKAKEEPDAKVRMNYTLPDFDGVVYHVCDSGPDKKRILVSISLKFFDELKQHGALEYLKKVYGDLLADEPKAGQSVTLSIDLDKLEDDYAPLARKCAMLKRNCMASVFVKFFDLQPTLEPKAAVERAVIHYRNDETLYVNAMHDRVTVIFSTMFKDPDDMLIGKVFMQEFTESQRRLDRAPQVLYSHRVPPAELQGTGAAVNDSLAYVTFVLYPRHVAPGSNRERTINLIHTLRNYLHYHIKCSKAYLHMRMRAKTAEFLKVLNRAHLDTSVTPLITIAPTGETPSISDGSKEEAGISGRAVRTG